MRLPGFTADASMLSATWPRYLESTTAWQDTEIQPAIPWLIPPVAIGLAIGGVIVGIYKWWTGPYPTGPITTPCVSAPGPCPNGGVGFPCVTEGAFCRESGWVYYYTGTCRTVASGIFEAGQCTCKCV